MEKARLSREATKIHAKYNLNRKVLNEKDMKLMLDDIDFYMVHLIYWYQKNPHPIKFNILMVQLNQYLSIVNCVNNEYFTCVDDILSENILGEFNHSLNLKSFKEKNITFKQQNIVKQITKIKQSHKSNQISMKGFYMTIRSSIKFKLQKLKNTNNLKEINVYARNKMLKEWNDKNINISQVSLHQTCGVLYPFILLSIFVQIDYYKNRSYCFFW